MNKTAFWILCCCVFLSSSCISLPSKKKTDKKNQLRHNLAISLIRDCKYRMALRELQKIIQVEPKEPMILHSMALVYFQLKQYNKAIDFFQKALRLKPEFTVAKVNLGRSFIEIDKLDKALKLLNQAEKDLTYPYPENIHNHIGLAHFKKKDFKEAEQHFRISRKVKSKDCMTALYHARTLYALEQFQKALGILHKSKSWCAGYTPCTTPNFDSYFFIALVYYRLREEQKAFLNMNTFIKKAEEDNPHYNQAKNLLNQWRR